MNCIGCGQPFEPRRSNQRRCWPRCRKPHGGRNKHDARDKRRAAHEVEFIALDGEGITYPDRHDYVLLTCGDKHLHHDGARLTTLDIFEFLWAQFEEHPQAAFVGFYLGYDFGQWLRDLPPERAWRLLSSEGIAARRRTRPGLPPRPVEWGDWQFDMLAGRRFRLRRRDLINHTPWLSICDAGPFFQSSFLAAIDPARWRVPIVTPEEYRIIAAGKAGRGADRFDAAMLRYNHLECDVLARLMRDQNEGFVAEGVRLNKTQWFGPGQVAQKWLKRIAAPTGEAIRDTVPEPFRDAARRAYFGGWFEIFWHGPVAGRSYGYDINSAYPAIMARLPCLLHGVYTSGEGMPLPHAKADALTLVEAHVRGSHPLVGAMPHRRKDHTILRPRETAGWYWLHEIEASRAAGFIDWVKIERWQRYEPCNCAPPLRAIADLYHGRIAVGKNTAPGRAKRLIYNSGYGKFAQSVGNPVFGNAVYASLITAGCRVMILDTIRTHPNGAADLLMVATDGVVFASEHTGLVLDELALGSFSGHRHDNLSLFLPGVYWDDDSRNSLQARGLKSRGISARDLGKRLRVIDEAWHRWRYDGYPRLVIPISFQLVSPRQAVARGKWELCGSVMTDGRRVISADPTAKRVGAGPGHSQPYGGTPELYSVPYARNFGDEPDAELDDFGDHPDGPVQAVLMRELMGH